jgi:EmrB/QacA subfamily drug resistance transporter
MGQTALISLSYLLILTSILIVSGKLADRIGLKKTLIYGYLLFAFGSLLCGISLNMFMLVIFRAVQGLGAAFMYVATTAIIPKYLPVNIRGKAFSILLTACTLGLIFGAPLGGIITSCISWHWIFLINVPFGIVACYVAYLIIPKSEPAQGANKNPFDIISSVLIFFCIGFLCFVANQGEEMGWLCPVVISIFAAAMILLVLFVRRQKRFEYPLIDLRIFNNRNFTYANLANIFAFAAFAGNNFLMPFFLTAVKGLSTNEAGFIILSFSITFMIANYFVGRIIDRTSLRALCAIGAFVAVIAYLVFALILGYSGLWPVILFLSLAGVSMGIFSAPINELVLNMTDDGEQGIISGIFKTGTNFGLILGVCIFELMFEQSIVHKISLPNKSIFEANIPTGILYSGFHFVYFSGLIINILALIFSLIVKERHSGKQGR